MRISAQQKEENRRSLVRAAVKIIGEQGFESTSLRQISIEAGLSEPVIYSYFPTKQSLLFGYLEDSIDQAFGKLAQIPAIDELSFSEKVQMLVQAHLEVLENDLVFVQKIFPLVFVTGLSTTQEALTPCRSLFTSYVAESLDVAIQRCEYSEPPLKSALVSMFWDYHTGLVSYWLKDQSPMRSASTEMIQRTMDLADSILKSQVLSKVGNLVYFLVRTHLFTQNNEEFNPSGTGGKSKVLESYRSDSPIKAKKNE